MKKLRPVRILSVVSTLACLSLTGPLYAASVSWIGADAITWTYNPDEVDNASATTAMVRAGIEYSDNFGVETHLALGGSDTVVINNNQVDVGLDGVWGVFFRAAYPISDARIYGLVGASNLTMSVDTPQLSGADRITRLSYGAGAEYLVNQNWVINADYMVYLHSESFTFSAISLGLRYRFLN